MAKLFVSYVLADSKAPKFGNCILDSAAPFGFPSDIQKIELILQNKLSKGQSSQRLPTILFFKDLGE